MTTRNFLKPVPGRLAIFFVLLLPEAMHAQGIVSTKHNLSALSGNTIRAQSNQQICIFCHTPHGSSQEAPLWNRPQHDSVYTEVYSSDFMTSISYPSPGDISAKSKLCMSCHDGTVALGTILSGPAITMQGSWSGGNLGMSFKDDHPVGVIYDVNNTKARLKTNPSFVALEVNASSDLLVECQTCHEPHNNSRGYFLRADTTNAAICTTCHDKLNFTLSAHSPGPSSKACLSCHKAHSGAGPYLQRQFEEATCFQGTGCHGTSGTGGDIQTEMAKTSAHPTTQNSSPTVKHKNRYFDIAVPGPETQSELGGNRHAECADCHNPHQAQQITARAATDRISQALKGTWGVSVNWAGITVPTGMTNNSLSWATIQSTDYMKIESPTDEYQVCLKCHSNYASPSPTRNIAQEIHPGYSSYHGIVPGGITNTYVNSTTAYEPWASGKRVWCSDCHGSENVASPSGPHGSLSSGVGPGTSNTDKLLVATIASSSSGTPLCLVCHKATSYLGASTGSRYGPHSVGSHQVAAGCFACHMWDMSTTGTTGGNTGKINAHGWNKKWVFNESTGGAGSGQAVEAFNGGQLANVDYLATNGSCFSESITGTKCNHDRSAKNDPSWLRP